MEEVVRAFNYVIEKGWVRWSFVITFYGLCSFRIFQAFYWATSEWSAREIEEAYREPLRLGPTLRYVHDSLVSF